VSLIQQQSRQVGKRAPHWITLSALRTLVVTTLLGRSGLQYGAKPLPMFDGVDFEALKTEVAHVVHAVLQRFAENFADKDQYLIGSPAIMAGIGVTAHRTIRSLPQRRATGLEDESHDEPMTPDQFLSLLADIRWDKERGIWDGIATRKTPKGVTTVAGPKEVGYAVAEAIDGSNPTTSAQIRGLRPEPQPQVDSWHALAPSMT
jgi:DNA sulfur modification protein DndB